MFPASELFDDIGQDLWQRFVALGAPFFGDLE